MAYDRFDQETGEVYQWTPGWGALACLACMALVLLLIVALLG